MLHVLRETEIEISEPESDDMRLRDAPGITEGRLDVLFCKPSKLKIEDGYNIRDLTTPEALKELDELEALVQEHGVRTPLKVRFDDGAGDIWIVEGHRRLIVVNRLLDKFRASGGSEGRKIEAVPIIAEPKGTTPLDRDFGLRHSNAGCPLKPLEFANLIYRTIHQRGISEKDAAKGFGVSITVLRNHLKLREMPEDVKQHVRAGDISATLAGKISKNVDPALAKKLIEENLAENKRIKGSKNRSTKVTAKTIKRDAPKVKPQEPKNETVQAQAPTVAVSASESLPSLPNAQLAADSEHQMGDHADVDSLPSALAATQNTNAQQDETVSVLIELAKQADLVVQHNQSDDNPGYWSQELMKALAIANDVVLRLTGKEIEWIKIADTSSQEEAA